jgi:hypothetical protein
MVLFALWAFAANADAWDDLKKSFTTVYTSKNISFEVDVKMYNSLVDKSPQLNINCSSYKKDKNFYSSFMGRITICNYQTKEMMEVDENHKTIIYSIIPESHKTDTIKLPKSSSRLLHLDTSFLTNSKATYLERTSSSTIIEIKPSSTSPYKSIQITLDSKSYLLKKIEYFPKKQENSVYYEHVVVDYRFNTSGLISDDIFKTHKYISRKGNEVKLKPAYLSYKLKNQLKPNKK